MCLCSFSWSIVGTWLHPSGFPLAEKIDQLPLLRSEFWVFTGVVLITKWKHNKCHFNILHHIKRFVEASLEGKSQKKMVFLEKRHVILSPSLVVFYEDGGQKQILLKLIQGWNLDVKFRAAAFPNKPTACYADGRAVINQTAGQSCVAISLYHCSCQNTDSKSSKQNLRLKKVNIFQNINITII